VYGTEASSGVKVQRFKTVEWFPSIVGIKLTFIVSLPLVVRAVSVHPGKILSRTYLNCYYSFGSNTWQTA
jgi:hypothetical protein